MRMRQNGQLSRTIKTMKIAGAAICLLLAFAVLSADGRTAAAGDWRFRRSYFSHRTSPQMQAAYPPPRSRSAYRPAYVSQMPGFSFESGYRINRIQINVGNSSDTTIIREGWIWFR